MSISDSRVSGQDICSGVSLRRLFFPRPCQTFHAGSLAGMVGRRKVEKLKSGAE